MASTRFHKETGLWLTGCSTFHEGKIVTLSIGSYSKTRTYLSGKPMWCEFTQFTMGKPHAFDERGEALWLLDECNPVCALDVKAEAA